mmetsp:Transcript_36846/g.47612  ORF Transcript_36846/g.47612 Transcript_36846/m.47612 type:complete len:117 (-) Transcript_36846:342-692(-)
MRCVDTDCSEAQGSKLAQMHDDDIFTRNGTLEVTEGVSYSPGRLVFFLPETPHKVTPLTRNTRAIIFMWCVNKHSISSSPFYAMHRSYIMKCDLCVFFLLCYFLVVHGGGGSNYCI